MTAAEIQLLNTGPAHSWPARLYPQAEALSCEGERPYGDSLPHEKIAAGIAVRLETRNSPSETLFVTTSKSTRAEMACPVVIASYRQFNCSEVTLQSSESGPFCSSPSRTPRWTRKMSRGVNQWVDHSVAANSRHSGYQARDGLRVPNTPAGLLSGEVCSRSSTILVPNQNTLSLNRLRN
jgi:hypothetical protein